MEYGGIFTADGATGTTNQAGIDDSHWEKMTGFLSKGPANGIEANAGVDELSIRSDGAYFLFCQFGFSGSTSTQFEFALLKNNEATPIQTDRNIAGAAATGSCSMGLPQILQAGDIISVGCRADAGGKEITIKSGQLAVFKVG